MGPRLGAGEGAETPGSGDGPMAGGGGCPSRGGLRWSRDRWAAQAGVGWADWSNGKY